MAELENGIDKSSSVLTYAEAFPPLSSPSPTNLEVKNGGSTTTTTTTATTTKSSSCTQAIPTSTVTQVDACVVLCVCCLGCIML